jgi:hypothetical protein
MKYGILKTTSNTGTDAELQCVFTTPLSIVSNQPAYVQDMLNLKRKVNSQNIQRWEMEANIEPSNNSSNFLVHSVMNGYDTVLNIRMPQVYGNAPVDIAANTSAVTNGISASTDTIGVSGTIPNVGEFVQFTNHDKVYLVVERFSTSMKIAPALLKNVTINENIKRGGRVTLKAYYDNAVKLGITYIDGILSDPGSVRFIEAI